MNMEEKNVSVSHTFDNCDQEGAHSCIARWIAVSVDDSCGTRTEQGARIVGSAY